MIRTAPTGIRRRHGFSLLELLVVIAIITMLIGLLFPSLKRARESARDTQCLSRIRSLYLAHSHYIHDYGKFPPLNNDEDDGTWQYNYLIFDGRDYEENFGPLVQLGLIDEPRVLFCPAQKDPYHSISTEENPWPAMLDVDTRAAYGRRYHLTGKGFSQIKKTRAILADVFHLPDVVKSAHEDGVNVAYSDGHGRWVRAPETLLDNELAHPFDRLDNSVVRGIWKKLDRPSQERDDAPEREINP